MPIPRNVKTRTKSKDLEPVLRKAIVYKQLQADKKSLEKDLSEIKETLRAYVAENGEEDPNTGSIQLAGNFSNRKVTVELQARNTTVQAVDIVDRLKAVLTERDFNKVVETVQVVRSDVLERLIEQGKIPRKVLSDILTVETSHAFNVKVN